MKLFPLDKDGASLEFSSEEWPIITEGLRNLGHISEIPQVDHATLVVGDVTLLCIDEEWDGPALLATDAQGVKLLQALAADITHKDSSGSLSKFQRRSGMRKRDHLSA